jgi:phytol kinase
MNVKSPRLPGKSRKTLAGSVTMVLVTFVIFVTLNLVYRQGIAVSRVILVGLLTSVCATLVEAYTPLGLDNLSVPIAIFFLSWMVVL